jgi:splicing factor 3A subunit 1
LKPTHGLFSYFTQLVESYSKVLIPRNDQLARLQKFTQDPSLILKTAGDRYLWDKYQEEEHKKRGEEAGGAKAAQVSEEQMQIDQIDWHDFVVVEKIDLYDDEEMKAIEDQEREEQA